jgi:hypothetical protein
MQMSLPTTVAALLGSHALISADVGGVRDEDVAFAHRFGRMAGNDRVDDEVHQAVEDRRAFGLRDQPPLGVDQRARGVVDLADDRRVRRVDPELVAELLTPAAARRDYGVVVVGGRVGEEETRTARGSRV